MIVSPEVELRIPQNEFSIRLDRDDAGNIMRRSPDFDGYEVRLSGHLPRRYAVVRLSAEALRLGLAYEDVGRAADQLIVELESELELLKAARRMHR